MLFLIIFLQAKQILGTTENDQLEIGFYYQGFIFY